MTTLAAIQKELVSELWWRGGPQIYAALRDEGQQRWVRRFWDGEGHAVWLIGRQRGKTYDALTMVDEFARSTPNAIIRYCAKTKDSALSIVVPNLDVLYADCPPELQPKREGDFIWRWDNGSSMVLFGTDAESFSKGRGPRTHLQLLDECGFYQDLVRVENALFPAFQTTGGKALYLSTPPESSAHPYNERIAAARSAGRLEHDTFWNNVRVNHEQVIRDEAARLGMTRAEFLDCSYFRREYLAQQVTETTRAAVPSWNVGEPDAEGRSPAHVEIVKEWTRPPHFDAYTGHDWGGQTGDPHAALFGYVDSKASKLIIEDEDEIRGVDTEQLIARWKAKETKLWGERKWDGTLFGAGFFEEHTKALPDFLKPAISSLVPSQPFIRVCDTDEQLQRDMMESGYAMLASAKHDKHLWVDSTVVLVRQRRLVIHPRCKRLIAQLYSTLWDKTRSTWEHTPLDHGDLLDCLVFIVRNVFWNHDPYPPVPVEPWGQRPKKTGLEHLAQAMTGKRR